MTKTTHAIRSAGDPAGAAAAQRLSDTHPSCSLYLAPWLGISSRLVARSSASFLAEHRGPDRALALRLDSVASSAPRSPPDRADAPAVDCPREASSAPRAQPAQACSLVTTPLRRSRDPRGIPGGAPRGCPPAGPKTWPTSLSTSSPARWTGCSPTTARRPRAGSPRLSRVQSEEDTSST